MPPLLLTCSLAFVTLAAAGEPAPACRNDVVQFAPPDQFTLREPPNGGFESKCDGGNENVLKICSATRFGIEALCERPLPLGATLNAQLADGVDVCSEMKASATAAAAVNDADSKTVAAALKTDPKFCERSCYQTDGKPNVFCRSLLAVWKLLLSSAKSDVSVKKEEPEPVSENVEKKPESAVEGQKSSTAEEPAEGEVVDVGETGNENRHEEEEEDDAASDTGEGTQLETSDGGTDAGSKADPGAAKSEKPNAEQKQKPSENVGEDVVANGENDGAKAKPPPAENDEKAEENDAKQGENDESIEEVSNGGKPIASAPEVQQKGEGDSEDEHVNDAANDGSKNEPTAQIAGKPEKVDKDGNDDDDENVASNDDSKNEHIPMKPEKEDENGNDDETMKGANEAANDGSKSEPTPQISSKPEKVGDDAKNVAANSNSKNEQIPMKPEKVDENGASKEAAEETGNDSANKGEEPADDDRNVHHKFINHLSPADGDEAESGYGRFASYFFVLLVVCIVGYLIFHNKKKLVAMALEGKRSEGRRGSRGGGGGRDRGRSAQYRKLDNNLEEAMGPNSTTSLSQVIY